jgi:hypothetical protein
MATVDPLTLVQGILSNQVTAPRPSEGVCQVIANIKDLCELQGMVDWRRGTQSYSNLQRFAPRGSPRATPRSAPVTPVTPDTPSPLPTHSPNNRYQSKFKNSTQPVEDKILNNIILSKLNKFSPATYADVRDFLYQILGSGDPDLATLVRDFIMLVFKKAASEEVYCALYAKLLAEISSRYTVVLEEMNKLQSNYTEIFEDVVEVPEGGDNYESFVEKNKEKRYRQGYSQFLAELTGLEILDLSTLRDTFQLLLSLIQRHGSTAGKKTLIDEYADCLVRMSKVLKKRVTPFFSNARSTLLESCGATLNTCISVKCESISPKSRFLLMDVKDILEGK